MIDQRWVNAGETITKGIDVNARLSGKLNGGTWAAMLEGSYLLEKKSRLIASAPMGPAKSACSPAPETWACAGSTC